MRGTLSAKIIDVHEEQEGQGPNEEVDVEDLVEPLGHPIRDGLSHWERDAEDDHQLAVKSCHDDPKAVSKCEIKYVRRHLVVSLTSLFLLVLYPNQPFQYIHTHTP